MTCPITGLPCNKHKSFQITEISKNEEAITFSLCQDCIADYLNGNKGIDKNKKVASELAGKLANLINDIVAKSPIKPCPGCGATLEDISKVQQVGCAKCYDHFDGVLGGVIKRVQAQPLKHVGKIPKNWKKPFSMSGTEFFIRQKAKMEQAVKTENYELAARIRDILHAFGVLQKRLKESVNKKDKKQTELLTNEIHEFMSKAMHEE
jgi:protein-arginine kinase activator protein McsA